MDRYSQNRHAEFDRSDCVTCLVNRDVAANSVIGALGARVRTTWSAGGHRPLRCQRVQADDARVDAAPALGSAEASH